jgi:hypothetical protein
MTRPAALLAALLLSAGAALAAPKAIDEILAAFQARLESGAAFDDLLEELTNFEPAELTRLQDDFDKIWPQLRTAYLTAFNNAAKAQNSGPGRQGNQKLIRELRDDFMAVRGMPEGPMKEALKTRSWPAVEQLREILLPTADRVLKLGDEELRAQREQILKLGAFRDGILKAAVAIEAPESVAKILQEEIKIAEEYSEIDRNGLRLMEKNRKTAEQAEIPEPERLGIEDANLMRLLVGLHALELDPNLCEAARGHSEDMNKLGFFSHTSPVPGKASPSDRASKAGTTGGGENIFMGSSNPIAANKGWFFSPGHHKNMFGGGYRRIGLGNYGSHWTQMFGG